MSPNTLGLSTEQYGWITAVFPFTYAVGGIACGFIIDKLGLRLSFSLLAGLWSLFNMLTALCSSWLPIAWLRGGLGVTEAAFNPAGMKVVAEWFPAKERGLACGVYSLGTSVGAMLAPPLVVCPSCPMENLTHCKTINSYTKLQKPHIYCE